MIRARLRSWWRGIFRRSRVESAMDDELLFHMESYAEDLQRSGVPEEEALRRARLEFGGVAQVKEECREANGVAPFENLFQDVRFALRMMAKSRLTTAILLITLALGIGANTAVFTLINGLLLRSLPIEHPEQLYFFGNDQWYGNYSGRVPTGNMIVYSGRFFHELRERNRSAFDGITAMSSPQASILVALPNSGEQSRRYIAGLVDGDFFRVLGVNAILGRVLVAEDDLPEKPAPVVVVSYRYWSQNLGGDPKAAGRTLLVNGAAFTLVGVTPPEFYGVKLNTQPTDFWFPLSQEPFLMNDHPEWLKADDVYWLDVLGRLKPGTDIRATSAALTGQLQQMMSALEGSKASEEQIRRIRESRIELVPGSTGISSLRDRFSPRLRVLAVLVVLVLVITSLNTANLLLSRATARQREMAVRLAMGARRGRVIRQLLTESLLLAVIGGLAGLALATWATRIVATVVFGVAPTTFSFRPDLRVLAFTFAVSLLSGIIFGLAPAFRSTKVDLSNALKDEFRSSAGGGRITPAKLLVSSQVVVSLAMLMGAGLFITSLRNLEAQDLGFVPEQVLTCRLDLSAAGYNRDNLPQLYSRVIERVEALPGVRSATLTDAGMLGGGNHTSNISIEGYTPKPNENMDAHHRHVTWNYVQTNGMTLLDGRDISRDDQQDTPHVAVVNEAFAQRYFLHQNPIGHRFKLGGPNFEPPGMTIVGVVKNSKYNSLDEKTAPMAFMPLLQEPFPDKADAPRHILPYVYGNELDVRVTGGPDVLTQSLRKALSEVDSRIPVYGITSLSERVSDAAHDALAIAQLSSFFGLLALILAAIGLYGVMAYNVSRRTREIGVRMAIGAEAYHVLRMVIRESLLVVIIGVALGIPAALGMGRLISSQLYGLSSHDPITLALATVLLLIACVLAAYLPARRAARIDPMVALRHE